MFALHENVMVDSIYVWSNNVANNESVKIVFKNQVYTQFAF